MRISRASQAAVGTLFVFARTSVAIQAACPLVRDALVQATLDPTVRSIAFRAQARVAATQVALDAIVIVRDDGQFYPDVVPARRIRDLESEGLTLIALAELGLMPITLTAFDIRRQPRFVNCHLVWFHRTQTHATTTSPSSLSVICAPRPASPANSFIDTCHTGDCPCRSSTCMVQTEHHPRLPHSPSIGSATEPDRRPGLRHHSES
jgi:hypothetical protein